MCIRDRLCIATTALFPLPALHRHHRTHRPAEPLSSMMATVRDECAPMLPSAVPLGRTGYGTTHRGDKRRCAAESCDVIIRQNQAHCTYCPCHCRDRVLCRRLDHRLFAVPGGETVPAAVAPVGATSEGDTATAAAVQAPLLSFNWGQLQHHVPEAVPRSPINADTGKRRPVCEEQQGSHHR